jgi:dihydrofolate reductase
MAANATVPEGEDFGYQDFIQSIDVLVIGRHTYEQVLTFGEWPYADRRVIVMSSRAIDIPAAMQGTVSCSSETPPDLVKRLSAEGARHLYVDGGVTIQRFLACGLIDDLTITIIPVILGSGRPLFGPLQGDIALNLIEARSFPCGFVQVKYQVRPPGG